MNPLTNVRNTQNLNKKELELGLVGSKSSWHDDFKDSAWIFVGGLPYDLTEGDLLAVFSQYGEIVNLNLVRDRQTGKSKGFGFLCYEDQRSTILTVDNFNGIKLLNRTLRVNHVADYKMPKEHGDEDEETLQLRELGCAPQIQDSPEEEDILPAKKIKKEKKKKKKKEKKKKSKKSRDASDSEVTDGSSPRELSRAQISSQHDRYTRVKTEPQPSSDRYKHKIPEPKRRRLDSTSTDSDSADVRSHSRKHNDQRAYSPEPRREKSRETAKAAYGAAKSKVEKDHVARRDRSSEREHERSQSTEYYKDYTVRVDRTKVRGHRDESRRSQSTEFTKDYTVKIEKHSRDSRKASEYARDYDKDYGDRSMEELRKDRSYIKEDKSRYGDSDKYRDRLLEKDRGRQAESYPDRDRTKAAWYPEMEDRRTDGKHERDKRDQERIPRDDSNDRYHKRPRERSTERHRREQERDWDPRDKSLDRERKYDRRRSVSLERDGERDASKDRGRRRQRSRSRDRHRDRRRSFDDSGDDERDSKTRSHDRQRKRDRNREKMKIVVEIHK